MAADGREIPGYYFGKDSDRRKYFKIERNHVATPSNPYSQQNVTRIQNERKKRKREETRTQARQQQTIRRRKILTHPFAAGTSIQREIGTRTIRQTLSTQSRAYLWGLCPAVRFNARDWENHRTHSRIGIEDSKIFCFDYDAATSSLLLGISDPLGGLVVSVDPSQPGEESSNESNAEANGVNKQRIRQLHAMRSDISSLHITRRRFVVSTSIGSSAHPSVNFTQLLDPHDMTDDDPLFGGGMSTTLTYSNAVSIWSSAPNPWGGPSGDSVAVGYANDVRHFIGQSHWHCEKAMDTKSDALALTWTGPQTLAVGLRNAEMHLWDSRSKGSVLRLRHRAPITGLKPAGNESQVVVNGLGNSLCLYDLRMIRKPSSSSKRRRRDDRREGGAHRLSEPLVRFEKESFEFNHFPAFNVDPALGFVIASEDHDNLSAFSLLNGERFNQWTLGRTRDRNSGDLTPDTTIPCIRIVEDWRGAPNILASYGPKIINLKW